MKTQRETMITEHISSRGISDLRILDAMRNVERDKFIPEKYLVDAYGDHPLPIGEGQTISQPYIVALMTQLCELTGSEKILEIGCGSGYQAAILSLLAAEIFSIERITVLANSAAERLKNLEYNNVKVILGDGYTGLPEEAPFDIIILTAAPGEIPPALTDQLKEGGRLIAPVGQSVQQLIKITKKHGELMSKEITYVRFVPMVKGFNL